MSQIKVVIFDHGGVLTRGGAPGTNEKIVSEEMGLPDLVQTRDLRKAMKHGKISNAAYVDRVNDLYPNAPRKLTDAVWDRIYATLGPDEKAYDFAARLVAAGYQVGILSNVSSGMADRLEADGMYAGFDPVVLSCRAGLGKPDPAAYHLIEAALPGVVPSEILFLDDQQKCIDPALARGWQGIRVDDTDQMIRDVTALLGTR